MRRLALVVIAALATSAAAQAPQAPPPGTRQVRIDLSPAGQTIAKKYLAAPDPVIVERVSQLRGVAQQIAALSNAPKLDLVRLQALLRQQETLQASVQRRGNDRMLAMLRELSEADRLKLVRSFKVAQPSAKPPGAQ